MIAPAGPSSTAGREPGVRRRPQVVRERPPTSTVVGASGGVAPRSATRRTATRPGCALITRRDGLVALGSASRIAKHEVTSDLLVRDSGSACNDACALLGSATLVLKGVSRPSPTSRQVCRIERPTLDARPGPAQPEDRRGDDRSSAGGLAREVRSAPSPLKLKCVSAGGAVIHLDQGTMAARNLPDLADPEGAR